MYDLSFSYHPGQDGIEVEGNTQAGTEFVDAWNQGTIVALDEGRIIVAAGDMPSINKAALAASLTIQSYL